MIQVSPQFVVEGMFCDPGVSPQFDLEGCSVIQVSPQFDVKGVFCDPGVPTVWCGGGVL